MHGCSKAKCKTNEDGKEYACESKDYLGFHKLFEKSQRVSLQNIYSIQLTFQDVLVLKVW